MRWAGRIHRRAALAPSLLPPSANLVSEPGTQDRGGGLTPSPDHRPFPSSSEEAEKNLRNLVEDEARACAILIK